jgi:hypothetical protein
LGVCQEFPQATALRRRRPPAGTRARARTSC